MTVNLFGEAVTSLEVRRNNFVFRYRSVEHWVAFFRTYYGPMLKTFGALDANKQTALAQDLGKLLQQFNRSDDTTLVVPSEYVEVIAIKG